MTTLEVFIAAHATSEWNELKQSQGHCDSDLSKAGRQMADRLSKRSDLAHVNAIHTSDLKRAYNTALPLSTRIGVSIDVTSLLREGNWEDHHEDPDYPPLPFEGGFEDRGQLTERAVKCVNGIAASERRSPILIITHGSFLSCFMAATFPDRFEEYRKMRAAINHLQYDNGTWRVLRMNDDSHLRDLDIP